ncbi:MAG: DUF3018 family protein [Acetobacter sp.]|nr:DUF3018 family protein [Acetobacter sp.]
MTVIPVYQHVDIQVPYETPSIKSISKAEFDKECQRQCLLAAEADSKDLSLKDYMDEDFEDVDGWIA